MSYIFRAENIVKKYAAHTALNDVSIEIPRGSIFGLLGPNGAGKTSMIRIINQIIGPDKGKLYFNNEELAPKHIANIGYLPEERGLYKKMKVGEQAIYLAQLKGLSKTEAKKKLQFWFEKFQLETWWDKKVEELSKGMQQKVQFIVTVLHEPELLILDEPFSGFDPINANLIKDEILQLSANGTTIVLSTHRMESVEEMCSHIALINKSKKILGGSIKDIRREYKTNQYRVKMEADVSSIRSATKEIAEILSEKTDDREVEITFQLPALASTKDLLQKLSSQGEIHHFNEVIPSMNDIFIKNVTDSNASK